MASSLIRAERKRRSAIERTLGANVGPRANYGGAGTTAEGVQVGDDYPSNPKERMRQMDKLNRSISATAKRRRKKNASR